MATPTNGSLLSAVTTIANTYLSRGQTDESSRLFSALANLREAANDDAIATAHTFGLLVVTFLENGQWKAAADIGTLVVDARDRKSVV